MQINEFKIVRLSDEQILALKNADKGDNLEGNVYMTNSADEIWFALGDVGLTNDDDQVLFDDKTYDEVEDLIPEDAIILDDETLIENESKLDQLENEGVLTWDYFISDSHGGRLWDTCAAIVTTKEPKDMDWLEEKFANIDDLKNRS